MYQDGIRPYAGWVEPLKALPVRVVLKPETPRAERSQQSGSRLGSERSVLQTEDLSRKFTHLVELQRGMTEHTSECIGQLSSEKGD